ncbi:MAG: aspartate dehydrogenase [Candidatus Methanospirare jalkutatii]|nr:aspartate dehydrogenase [Candidatus Methanospirare jalkutatii]
MMLFRVGVIGCGAIGSEICKAIDTDSFEGRTLGLNMRLSFLIDKHKEKIENLCEQLRHPPAIKMCGSTAKDVRFDEILHEVDLVIECASQSAVKEFVIPALEAGKDVMILSVGALAEEGMLERIEKIAREHRCDVYIPSGAIAGLDGLKSAAVSEIYEVRLTTRKPPAGFEGNRFVKEKGIDLAAVQKEGKPLVLFEGVAADACRIFPENVNVAASLSIAGIGARKTKVRVIADPRVRENTHEIEVRGAFGSLCVRVENVPSPTNPKTSHLAALSAIATLKRISHPLKVGT